MPAKKKYRIRDTSHVLVAVTLANKDKLDSVESYLAKKHGKSRLSIPNSDVIRECIDAGAERVGGG